MNTFRTTNLSCKKWLWLSLMVQLVFHCFLRSNLYSWKQSIKILKKKVTNANIHNVLKYYLHVLRENQISFRILPHPQKLFSTPKSHHIHIPTKRLATFYHSYPSVSLCSVYTKPDSDRTFMVKNYGHSL